MSRARNERRLGRSALCWVGGGETDLYLKPGAIGGFFKQQGGPVALDHFQRNGQAQTGAFDGRVGAHKWLPDALPQFGRNARSMVTQQPDDFITLVVNADLHGGISG